MKKQLILLIFLLKSLLIQAQYTEFSLYNLSKINTNPAFAGSDSSFVFASAYLYDSLSTAYHFSLDNYFHAIRGGLGISYSSENRSLWDEKGSVTSLSYAPHFELFNHKLVIQPGLQVGYYVKSFTNPGSGYFYNNQLVFSDPVTYTHSYWTFAAGLLLYNKMMYGGMVIQNFTQPKNKEGTYQLYRKTRFHGGLNLPLGNFTLSPNLLLATDGFASSYQIGINARYKWMILGGSIRSTSFFIANGGFQNQFFQLSYSYLTGFSSFLYRSHEIHLNFFIPHSKPSLARSLRLI